MYLCPTCHGLFDRNRDPGFVFIPEDLDYFIDWERRDREMRQEAYSSTGRVLPRRVPSAEVYLQHHLDQNRVQQPANGGLYRAFFLTYDIPRPPKIWHGDPMASIRRGIAILGSSRIGMMDRRIVDQLRTLQDLYFRDDLNFSDPGQLRTIAPSKRSRDEPEDHHEEQDDTEPPRKRRYLTQSATNAELCAKNQQTFGRTHPAITAWWLGPNCTADDAIQQFAGAIVR